MVFYDVVKVKVKAKTDARHCKVFPSPSLQTHLPTVSTTCIQHHARPIFWYGVTSGALLCRSLLFIELCFSICKAFVEHIDSIRAVLDWTFLIFLLLGSLANFYYGPGIEAEYEYPER